MAENDFTDVRCIPGIEAKHTATSARGVVLPIHDPQGPLPRMKVNDINGLFSLPDLSDQREVRRGAHGEIPLPAFRTGKTVTYEGPAPGWGIQAQYLNDLRTYERRLGEVLGDTGEIRVDFQRYSAVGHAYFFKARVVSFDPDEKQTIPPTSMPSPWQRTVTLTLRLGDPFVYLNELSVYTSPVASGAANPQWNVTNIGTAPATPVFRLTGPIQAAIATDDLTGRKLAFSSAIALGAGVQYDFDFKTRRVTQVSNGAIIGNAIDWAATTWLDEGDVLTPGTRSVTLSQAAGFGFPGAGARGEFRFYPPFWS